MHFAGVGGINSFRICVDPSHQYVRQSMRRRLVGQPGKVNAASFDESFMSMVIPSEALSLLTVTLSRIYRFRWI